MAFGSNLYLIGMMGSGKSTVGALLAPQLGLALVDLDAELAAASGMSVAEIFARFGEAEFRQRESSALWQLSARRGQVMALGGGALVRRRNLERAVATGRLVWLQATPEELARRIGGAGGRPLLAAQDQQGRVARLTELLAERAAGYRAADFAIATDGRSAAEIAEQIARWWAGVQT